MTRRSISPCGLLARLIWQSSGQALGWAPRHTWAHSRSGAGSPRRRHWGAPATRRPPHRCQCGRTAAALWHSCCAAGDRACLLAQDMPWQHQQSSAHGSGACTRCAACLQGVGTESYDRVSMLCTRDNRVACCQSWCAASGGGGTFEPCKPAARGTRVHMITWKGRWSCESYPAEHRGVRLSLNARCQQIAFLCRSSTGVQHCLRGCEQPQNRIGACMAAECS